MTDMHKNQPINESNIASGETVDPDEVAFFARIADEWWDPTGPFRPLHKLNPCRLGYIRDQVCTHFDRAGSGMTPFADLEILDIGCGGGLISEPLARLGATVTSVDASERNIEVAKLHAAQSGLTINYQHTTAEALAATGKQFDVVVNMEVIEHVADVEAYLRACRQLVKPGGLMLLSTINRTAKAWVFAIVGAEYVLRWLPKGAHDWNKFITPKELAGHVETAEFSAGQATGFVFNPLNGKWKCSDHDTSVNYALIAKG